MSESSDGTRALDELVERVRGKFGDEAADEVRASAGALRSEVWASDGVSGIGDARGKEARRALERGVDQAAKRMGDDPLARRIRKDGRLKDLIAEWLFGLYLEETGGAHRTHAKPPVHEGIEREPRTTRAERDDFGLGFGPARGPDLAARSEIEEMAPPPRAAPRPASVSAPSHEPERGTRSEDEVPAPAERPEPVFMGACAPAAVRPGDSFSAEFAAYVKRFEPAVREILGRDAPGSVPQLGVKGGRWKVDAPVVVRLTAPDLVVDGPEQEFTWDGEYWTLEFPVQVPADAPERRTVLTFEVSVAGVRVGRMALGVEIGPERSDEAARAEEEAVRSVFVSYAHEDRTEVYQRISSLEAFFPVDFFVDREKLRMGEVWSERLEEEILKRDMLLLFWSPRARESEWVTKEWTLALDRKGEDDLQLHLLELVPIESVPEPLQRYHLDDRWLRLAMERATPGP
jgi:hypothetical protein